MNEIKNFAIIYGSGSIENGIIQIKEQNSPETEKDGIAKLKVRTDAYFSNGTIEFKAKFENEDSGCLVVLKGPSKEVFIGCSKVQKSFIVPNNESINSVGSLSNYNLKEELIFKIDVRGSIISLYINNVLISEGQSSILKSPIAFRLSGLHTKIFDIKFKPIKPKVFVIMQFSEEYNILYNDVIKPIAESYDLECIRADEFYTSSPILKDIIDSIKEAYIIIAEITPDNPNVFYEIGYAHAINKPTILLCDKKREKLPFDISGFRTLFYENSIGGKKKVESDLKKFVSNILK